MSVPATHVKMELLVQMEWTFSSAPVLRDGLAFCVMTVRNIWVGVDVWM